MINPAVFIKIPIVNKGYKVYPPPIKEVVGNPNFNIFYKVLTYDEDDIKDEIKGKLAQGEQYPTPFEHLFLKCYFVKEYFIIVQQAFYFFCRCNIQLNGDEKYISLIYEDGQVGYLNQESFLEFQNLVREACGDKPKLPPEPPNPNEDPRITAMKEKARQRDRIKAKQKPKDGISLTTCLVAICCMGIGITPLNIGEMSYASIGPIMKTMQDKEKYDIDIRSLLAGASSKKVKPKYWIRNSDKE